MPFNGWLVGLGTKFRDTVSMPSLNGSPLNLHTSLMWGQALKPAFESSLATSKIWREKPQSCLPHIHVNGKNP